MFAKRNILTIVSRINYIILFTLFNTQLTLINKYTQLVKMNIAHQNKSFEIYTDYSGSSSFAQLNCRDSNGAARKDSFRFKIHDGKYFTIPCRKKRLRERERERKHELVEWRLWLGRETFIGIHECSPLVLAALNNYASLLFDYGPGSMLNDDSPRGFRKLVLPLNAE